MMKGGDCAETGLIIGFQSCAETVAQRTQRLQISATVQSARVPLMLTPLLATCLVWKSLQVAPHQHRCF